MKAKLRMNKWIIIGSNSWIKGVDDAKDYCKENNLRIRCFSGALPYEECLEKLASSQKDLVFLPEGWQIRVLKTCN